MTDHTLTLEESLDGQPTTATPSGKRRIPPALAGFGAAALLAGAAWLTYHYQVGQFYEETDDAYLQSEAVTVAPKLSGYVAEVLAKENEQVKAGQPLVRIDPRDAHAQVEQYQAQIGIARANAQAVRAQIGEQEAAVRQARAQLATARTNAAYAAAEERRYAPLVEIGAETAEQFANRRNQAAQSAQQVDAYRAALETAEKRIVYLRAQVEQVEAQAASAEAQLKTARINLASTTISATVDGRIGDQTVRPGQFVQQGTRLMSLVPSNSLYINANFKETQIGRMRVGQSAEIKVDALPGLKLHGHVDSIAPGTGAQFSLLPPQNATGNFTKIVQRVPVRITLDSSPETRRVLLPGLSVKVTVETSNAKDAVKRILAAEDARAGGRK
ncbi:multidrug ABC transporter permease [Massilia phosphatilytica]|nr:multidrug ABC transporter permease [Massilia phosphatilytica]